ncbi:sigma-70 family RNA polymerase sigma factor [Nakamurella silvestris]|nr:sigma-70 family RNA polymerase sigma factor [Nakamurella silvestris]
MLTSPSRTGPVFDDPTPVFDDPTGRSTGSLVDLNTLLTEVGSGDVTAFNALYDRVSAKVFHTIIRVLVDRSQSEEVCQDVMVEVWRRAARFDATLGSALPWILAIAHARAIDRVRSSQKSRERDTNYTIANLERDRDVVIESVVISHDREMVARALATLTAAQRECLHLAYYAGKTQIEIAELLRVPLGTIKTRTRSALARLRDPLRAATAL